MTYWWLLIFQQ